MHRDDGTRSARASALGAALVACALALLCVPPAWAGGIDGQVFDGEGKPLAGVVVRVLEVPPAPLLPRKNPPPRRPVEIASARTDAAGFFHLDVAGWKPRGRILLTVGDRGPWDPLRYARPAARDLTRDLRRDAGATVTIRVPDAPGWADLRRAIEKAGGPGTRLGRLLRRHGFPRRVVADAAGRLEYDFGEERFLVRDGQAGGKASPPRPAAMGGETGR